MCEEGLDLLDPGRQASSGPARVNDRFRFIYRQWTCRPIALSLILNPCVQAVLLCIQEAKR